MAVRTTVHIDEQLLSSVRRRISPRGLSRFVNEAVAEKMQAIERREIEEAMREGYLASGEDQRDIDQDWRVVETEGWPE